MANLAYDSNKNNNQGSSTDVLAPSNGSSNAPESSSTESAYVSNGNPYGNYSSPQQSSPPQAPAPSANSTQSQMRKTQAGPTSGTHTNVQTYANKNQQSAQKLGGAVEGKLQNTADLVRQNAGNVNKQFQQGVESGSLANYQTAKERAGQSFNEAAKVTAPTKEYVDNTANMYAPTKNAEGAYSAEDQALVDSNKARVTYGDQTTKEFDTALEAQNSIEEWNRLNPGYNQYGDQQQLSMSDKELSDILNAKYTGPTDLYQTTGYNDLVNEFGNAQGLQNQALQDGYKGELLRQTFSNPNTDYTLGQKQLDDLLLGQGDVGASLKQKAKTLGSTESGLLSDEFEANKQSARDTAAQRGSDLDEVRTGSRALLDQTAQGREKEVNDRLAGVIEDWDKYPQYFRDQLTSEMGKHEDAMKRKVQYDKVNTTFKAADSEYNDAKNLANQYTQRVSDLTQQIKDFESNPNFSNKNPEYLQAQSALSYNKQYIANANKDMQSALNKKNTLQQQMNTIDAGSNLAKFDPNNMNLGLSQLEAEMLGIKGGEGLYNIIKNQGVDGLIATAKADNNQLISRDEQNQLARLQSIAELANDYGSKGSGINFANQFTDRDAAGEQNALSALDMDNFTNLLQGGEKQFRDYAKGANITGKGTGKATDGGLFGTKKKTSTKYLTDNLGKLVNKSGGYRNMYGEDGVDQDNINSILGLAKGMESGSFEGVHGSGLSPDEWGQSLGLDKSVAGDALNAFTFYANPGGALETVGSLGESIGSKSSGEIKGVANQLLGDNIASKAVGQYMAAPTDILAGVGKGVSKVGNAVSGALFGSSSGLQAKADKQALKGAQKDLKKKVSQALVKQGYGNQLNVMQNDERDMELLKLLGLLDTTNVKG